MGIVTISASYGARGSEVGPAVAAALGLPFVDRAIPVSVADRLGVSLEDATAKDETVTTGLWRVISSMALVPDLSGAGTPVYGQVPDEREFREQTERVLHEIATSSGGVILGRAGAVVLVDASPALHVRLDGPPAGRLAIAREHAEPGERVDESVLRDNDSARAAYWRHFYRRDWHDCRQYHLVIDATAMAQTTVVELILGAARDRGVAG